ncbi:uncharacterized protein LOC116406051 [Cucumis sativus]|uniref:uncharacterized protein LOC116406051 n=1 Tax=Cucumis sativus TaxID=3659 RepID=UPI0012F4F867|nr:uncharacterized protein LOC116406051 [Cucumis sativus]
MLFSSSLAISIPPSSPILVAISTLFNLNLLNSLTLTGLTSMSLEPPLLLLVLPSSKNPLDYQTLLFLSFLILVSLPTPVVSPRTNRITPFSSLFIWWLNITHGTFLENARPCLSEKLVSMKLRVQ